MNDAENDVLAPRDSAGSRTEAFDIETVPTTAADVESAGRSCMAIVIVLGLIVLLLALWLALRSIGVGS